MVPFQNCEQSLRSNQRSDDSDSHWRPFWCDCHSLRTSSFPGAFFSASELPSDPEQLGRDSGWTHWAVASTVVSALLLISVWTRWTSTFAALLSWQWCLASCRMAFISLSVCRHALPHCCHGSDVRLLAEWRSSRCQCVDVLCCIAVMAVMSGFLQNGVCLIVSV